MKKKKLIITNENQENLRERIVYLAKNSTHISIAVAYFSDYETISKWIADGIKVDLIISLTPPTNYYSLKKIFPKKNLIINYFGKKFHSKIYTFKNQGGHFSSIVGSSNFTSGGLANNIETNVEIIDKNTLKQLRKHIENIEQKSSILEPNILANYKETYDKFIKSNPIPPEKKNSIKSKRLTKVGVKAKGYLMFWKAADNVCSLVENISNKEYPKIPIYLTVDHFWHWVVKVWDRREAKRIQKEDSYREKTIPVLFQRYCKWDRSGSGSTAKMFKWSKRASSLLSKKHINKLNKDEAMEIFSILHSTGRPIQQFAADESFKRNNRITKIRKAFHYLLYSDNEVTVRIDRLIKRDSEYSLKFLGPSGVQELLGWVNPAKYPLRNQKADEAIKLLGY